MSRLWACEREREGERALSPYHGNFFARLFTRQVNIPKNTRNNEGVDNSILAMRLTLFEAEALIHMSTQTLTELIVCIFLI